MTEVAQEQGIILEMPYNWEPRLYQLDAWKYMQGPDEGKRAALVWHRRAGKDLFGINLVGTKAFERVGTYWHVLPTYKQGRKIVWNGFTRDGRKFLDHFPEAAVQAKNSTEMRITFINGSQYEVVGSDNIDSLVGTNPIGVIMSEYSLHDPAAWNYIRPILAENGGWAVFIYTARGRNHGHTLLELAKKNKKWFWQILKAGSGEDRTKKADPQDPKKLVPVISDEIIEQERKDGMPEPMIEQEFYCSFEAPFVGAYYGPQMMTMERTGRLVEASIHDPQLPVDTAWDLGINDTMVVWFIQQVRQEIRIIDVYGCTGEGLPHVVRVLRGDDPESPWRGDYVYGTHYGPHDITVRELGTGKSRLEVAKSLGIRFKVGRQHEVQDGIDEVRRMLGNVWISKPRCDVGIEALRQYRKKWDEVTKTFQGHPLHDWTSNYADALRVYAMGRRRDGTYRGREGGRQQVALDEHKYI